MIVDAHQHSFWSHTDDAGLVANLDANGIDVAWLLTWEIPPFEHASKHHRMDPRNCRPDGTHAGVTLADQIRTRDAYPDRFILGYCGHPLLDGAPERLEAAHKMYGLRVCGEWKFRILLDDPRCLEVFRVAGRLSMPVVVHLCPPYRPNEQGRITYDPGWFGGTIINLERAMQACPDTVFVGHAPGFWREISGDADSSPSSRPSSPVTPGGRLIGLLENYSNLYCDLSATSALYALQRDTDHAKNFLMRFADRMLFARDCHTSDLHEFLQGLDLPRDVAEKIYHQNACRLVPLNR